MKILVVEDNEQVARFVCKGLKEAGHTVDRASDGKDGMALATSEPYNVIVMDRMLPGDIDGLSIISALRSSQNDVPVLILSSIDGVDEKIRGLRCGADDYLAKPFAFGELIARIDALVRRSRSAPSPTTLVVGDLHLNLLTRKVTRGEKPVTLRPQEFKLLEYLMRNANQVVTRTMLLENVWDYHFDPRTNVIDVHVSKLRQEIDHGADIALLRTIRSAGYMITADD